MIERPAGGVREHLVQLFSSETHNPDMPLVELTNVPINKGTRDEIEAFYDAVWTDYGLSW